MPQNRLQELDVLRGFAAIMVVMFHYTSQIFADYHPVNYHFPLEFKLGEFGVELFFIISGFVIFWSIKTTPSIKLFMVGRFARLFPAYILSVTLIFVLSKFLNFPFIEFSNSTFIANLSMFQAIPNSGIQNIQKVYWTLGSELLFYGFMLLVLLANAAKHILKISLLLLIFSILMQLFRQYFHLEQLYTFLFNYLFIGNNLPLFIIGICLNKIYLEPKMVGNYLVLMGAFFTYAFLKDAERTMAVALFMVLFFAIIFGKFTWLVNSFTLFLGKISYSLYLFHQIIGYYLLEHLSNYCSGVLAFCITCTTSIFIAAFVNKFVEVPAQNFIKNSKFFN